MTIDITNIIIVVLVITMTIDILTDANTMIYLYLQIMYDTYISSLFIINITFIPVCSKTDFRDGVRLVRLMEVLTRRNTGHMERVDEKQKESEGDRRSQSKCSGTLLTFTSSSTLSSASRLPSANLRVPATSRLQKLHNVSLALKLLYGMGPLPLPRHTGISASPVHVLGCGESSAAAQCENLLFTLLFLTLFLLTTPGFLSFLQHSFLSILFSILFLMKFA